MLEWRARLFQDVYTVWSGFAAPCYLPERIQKAAKMRKVCLVIGTSALWKSVSLTFPGEVAFNDKGQQTLRNAVF